MGYNELFVKYGHPCAEADINMRCFLLKPETLKEKENVSYYDNAAARFIAQCEATAERLKAYRQALAKRYAELETMAYTERIELERCPHWQGHIEYWVRIVKRYEDGCEVTTYSKRYLGKERREALKHFEKIKHQRPGIQTEKNIEKKSWEK